MSYESLLTKQNYHGLVTNSVSVLCLGSKVIIFSVLCLGSKVIEAVSVLCLGSKVIKDEFRT